MIEKKNALSLDEQDVLKDFRKEFFLPHDKMYMDGNSLGLLSKRAERTLLDSLEDWKTLGIDGWMNGNHPWFTLSEKIGEELSELIGALPDEVMAASSTTVNLHQLVSSFYKPEGKKTKILADELTFPSDIYALQSQLLIKGYNPEDHLIQVASSDGMTLSEEDIISQMTDEVALILLPSVLYRSGQLLDMKRLAKEAHARSIVIGFDLCHSIGAVPHRLSEWGVDFAFWCNYKYLNGGPGSVAGLYVNNRHFGKRPGLAGWFGSDKNTQFDMEHTFVPASSAGAYQIGTPHVLSTAPLIGSLEIFKEAGIERIRAKSLQLTRFLMELVQQELLEFGFVIGNPDEDSRRGGHVALQHKEAARICKSLKELGVIPDFRAPDVIRLAPAALYTSFADVYETVNVLKRIMQEKHYEKYENTREVIA
ncbi:kynureninase [Fictibacillus aquaticus]|uniref:kynureninase n=1 Tax=Fictibacillus aquaticus TaxID=2021314 RepID=UPI001F0AF04C|nr:kynureninase [Fictibacillus aquaticus]